MTEKRKLSVAGVEIGPIAGKGEGDTVGDAVKNAIADAVARAPVAVFKGFKAAPDVTESGGELAPGCACDDGDGSNPDCPVHGMKKKRQRVERTAGGGEVEVDKPAEVREEREDRVEREGEADVDAAPVGKLDPTDLPPHDFAGPLKFKSASCERCGYGERHPVHGRPELFAEWKSARGIAKLPMVSPNTGRPATPKLETTVLADPKPTPSEKIAAKAKAKTAERAAELTVRDPDRGGKFKIDQLFESPTNPRKSFGDMVAFTESIKRIGAVLQELTLRKVGDRYEVVAGNRRLRGAIAAGLLEVPGAVFELSDSQVAEIQLIENCQRKDLEPLEEADGYRRLLEEHHYSKEQIAAKVSKSIRWVETKLQLLKLSPEVQRDLTKGKINVSVALVIARIPHHKLQSQAVELAKKPGPNGKPLSVEAVEDLIREQFTTELGSAPFNTKDDMLVPEAGSCTKCPKRSDNNPDLFSDLNRAVCTDLPCFQSKCAAAWEQQRQRAEADGKKVLPLQVGRALFKTGALGHDAGYVSFDGPCNEDSRRRTWRQLLGDRLDAKDLPPVFVAADRAGKTHDLLKKPAAYAAARKAGLKWADKLAAEHDQHEKARDPAERDRKALTENVRKQVVDRVLETAVGKLESSPLQLPDLRVMARALLNTIDVQWHTQVLERRGMTEAELEKSIEKKWDAHQLGAFVFELSVVGLISDTWHGYGDDLIAIAERFKVDVKAADAALTVQAEAEARAQAEKIEKKSKKPKAKKSKVEAVA